MALSPGDITEARTVYETYWESYLKGNIDAFAACIDDAFSIIGTSEGEVRFGKEAISALYEAQFDEVVGKAEPRNRQVREIPTGDMLQIIEFSDIYVLIDSKWSFYSKFRLSTLLHQTPDGWKLLQQHGSLPDMRVGEGETVAIEKISKENLELRDAVKRRTSELESKNRELEIEAALERVRAVAMGMKKPEDMLAVCREITAQLQLFGVDRIRNVQTAIIDAEIGQYLCYQYFAPYDRDVVETTEYLKSPVEHEMVKQMLASQDAYFTNSLSGSELEAFRTHRKAENHFPDPLLDEATEVHYCFLSIGEGGLGLTLYTALDEDVLNLFRRFHQVFSLAYRRFRDIQKAEAQAREAQLEAALERVRSRSLAMHHSSELSAVVDTLLTEFTNLEFTLTFCIINLIDEQDMSNTVWAANPETGKDPESYYMKFEDYPFHHAMWDAWKAQKKRFIYTIEGEEKKIYDEYLYSETEFSRFPKNVQDANKALERYVAGFTFFKYSGLQTVSENYISEEDLAILERFGNVFDQAYTRFLDLQKAEAQAREANIETALEKVRSRSLGMQKSDELQEVIQIVYAQFAQLGIEVDHTGFIIDYPTNEDMHIWLADRNGVPSEIRIPYFDAPHWNSFVEAKKNGGDFFINHHDFEEKNKFYNTLFELIPGLSEEIKAYYLECPGLDISTVLMDNVGLYIERFSGTPYTDADNQTLKRFGKVFQQAYTRFLDLQKAETQAREAQIEVAVERVRAKALAMHKSREILQVAITLKEQMEGLNLRGVTAATIYLQHDESKIRVWDITELNESEQGPQLSSDFTFSLEDTDPGLWVRRVWNAKEKYSVIEMSGDDFIKCEKWIREFDETAADNYREFIRAAKIEHTWHPTVQLEKGKLNLDFTVPPPPEMEFILPKMGAAFDLAYRRFLDLQKAEAQAHEAQIELSLERIRAQVTAMQESSDLLDIVVTMRSEFVKLGHEAHYFWHMRWLPETYAKAMTSGDGTKIGMVMTLPRHIHGDIQPVADWEKSDEPIYVLAMDADMAVDYVDKMISLGDFEQVDPQAPTLDDIRQIGGLTFVMARTTHGEIGYSLPGVVPDPPKDAVDTLVRFAGVFDLAYKRFEDLKAAERQHREAQIELALERVRARTMAMQSSEELADAAFVLFEQLRNLGGNLWGTGFGLCKENVDKDEFWFANENGVFPPVAIPNTTDPAHKQMYKGWREKTDFLSIEKSGAELKSHYDYMLSLPEVRPFFQKIIDEGLSFPERQQWNAAYFSQGYLLIITLEPYPEPEILKRFAKVFEQTYTRFLDLQKAEAQAREARIETALEKVRSRSLAMHKSDELKEVVSVLFEKLKDLQIPFTAVGIATRIEGSKDLSAFVCGQNEAGLVITNYRLPYFDNPVPKDLYSAIEEQLDYFVGHYSKEEKDSFYEYVIEHTAEFRHLPEDIKHMIFDSTSYTISMVAVKNAVFNVNDFEGKVLTESEIDIIKRFARVFDQAYTRFLDLKKAEDQAREAQINLSVERVRARALAMHKSEEIIGVVAKLKNEVMALDIPDVIAATIILKEGDDKVRMWDLSSLEENNNGDEIPFDINFKLKKSDPNLYVKRVWENPENYFVELEETKDFKRIIEWLRENDKNVVADEVEVFIESRQIKKLHHAVKKLNNGKLVIDLLNPPPDEMETLLTKMGAAFDLAYRRFEDLQKAEGQAREAKIEAALEKVRSRTMGMQRSDELADVANVLFAEMNELVHNLWTCGFVLCEKGRDEDEWWLSLEDGFSRGFFLPNVDDYAHATLYEGWLEGDVFRAVQLDGDKLQEHYDGLMQVPVAKNIFDEMEAAGMQRPEWQKLHAAYFSKGYLVIITREPCPEEEIFKRFATVFDQTYTRFLDLQKAEAQTRKAQIEASLERVRAKAMSMQNSDELDEVLSVLCEQFDVLGILPMSTHMTVFNFSNNTFTFRETGKYGDRSFGEQTVDLDAMDTWKETVDKWKADKATAVNKLHFPKETLPEVWEVFHESFASMPEESRITPDDYPDGIYHTAGKHPFGYIGMNQVRPATGEEEQIVIKFANEFGRAYQRFLDLQKAEAQAREAKIETALEKIRSRTMGMQSSEELPEVANMLFLEVQALEIPAWSCGYCILLEDRKSSTCIMSSEGTLQKPFLLPHRGEVSFEEWDDFVRSDETFFTQELGGRAIESHYGFMKSLPQLEPIFRDLDDAGLSLPTYQINHLCKFSHGFVLFITYEPVLNAHDIFRRFTKVFDQTYTRFLDLKKAEAQAREAQIETALEKVRSRSLAMQSPDELIEVAQLLREEMGALGVEELETSSIYIHNENSGKTQCWFTIKDSPSGKAVTDRMTMDLQDTWVGREMLSFYHSDAMQTSVLMQGEQRVEWIRYCGEKSNAFTPEGFYGESIPERTYHLYKFSDGYIGAASPGDISHESWDLLKRATAVFSFAYTRFRDLQKAENRAREARIELALERIRAQVASMQESSDLFDIVVGMRTEFLALGHEADYFWHMRWLPDSYEMSMTSEDGSRIGMVISLPKFVHDEIPALAEWEQGDDPIYVLALDAEGGWSYIENMNTHGSYELADPNAPTKDDIERIGGLTFIMARTTHGEIGYGLPGMVPDPPKDALDTLVRFAGVFDLAYKRFEDLKASERQALMIREERDRLEIALNDLRATQAQLVQQEKLASLGQLTAGIAHEIKNPLNFVNNFSEVSLELIEEALGDLAAVQMGFIASPRTTSSSEISASQPASSPENESLTDIKDILNDIQSNLTKIHQHGTRANGIVSSMLQHSRGGSGKPEPTDLNALVKEYVNLAFHGMRAGKNPINVKMDFHLDPNLGDVNLIGEDFSRVVLNLSNNAFDAMREKSKTDPDYNPEISIATKRNDNSVELSIADNGPGIPDEIKDKILQPFFTTKKGTEGTGLGLSITHDIVKAHGGELEIETAVHKGTMFILKLNR